MSLRESEMTYQPYSAHNNTPNLEKAKIFSPGPLPGTRYGSLTRRLFQPRPVL